MYRKWPPASAPSNGGVRPAYTIARDKKATMSRIIHTGELPDLSRSTPAEFLILADTSFILLKSSGIICYTKG
jgi:hypothetical protein